MATFTAVNERTEESIGYESFEVSYGKVQLLLGDTWLSNGLIPFALAFIVHTFCLARAHGTINSQRQHTHTHARKHARIIIIIIMCSFLYHFSFGAQGPLHETK